MLGLLGDPAVVDEARRRFRAFQEDPTSLQGPIRLAVLRITAAHADSATYEALRSIARQTAAFVQKQQLYEALAYARDPALARETLALSLTDEPPSQLRPLLIQGVASNGQRPDLAWNFLVANFDAIAAGLDSGQRHELPAAVASRFADASWALELREFAAHHIPADARAEADKAAAMIELRAKVRAERLPEVDGWLAEHVPPR